MRFQSVAAAALAVASANAAQMSPRDIFGYNAIHARADGDVYTPTTTFCGMGDTCAEACGATFDMCPSDDESIHCFDKSQQKCCPGGKGVSCDTGYYCANNAEGSQICCPEGKTLAECAGAVASLAPLALTTSTSAAPTVAAPTYPTNNFTVQATGTGTYVPKATGTGTGVVSLSSAYPVPTSAASTTGGSSPVPTTAPSSPPAGAGSAVAPAGMLALAVAGLVALF